MQELRNKQSALELFFNETSAQLVIPEDVPVLPRWFQAILSAKKCETLEIVREGNSVSFLKSGLPFTCLMGKDQENSYLKIAGQGTPELLPFVAELPPFLEILQKGLETLMIEASITLFKEGGSYLECCMVTWDKEIQVIKGFLSLSQPRFAIVRMGLMEQIILSGMIEIAGIGMTAEVYLSQSDSIEVQIGSAEEIFPSFKDFIIWTAKSSIPGTDISWLEELGCPVDVAISGARIEIDHNGGITGFMIQTKLTLWNMELDVRFQGPNPLLSGRLWRGQEFSVGELLKEMGVPGDFETLKSLMITGCFLEMDFSRKEYELRCAMTGSFQVAGVELEDLTLIIGYGKEKGIALCVEGKIVLEGGVSIEAGVSYESEKNAWVLQGGIGVPNGITVRQVLEFAARLAVPVLVPEFLNAVSLQSLFVEYHTDSREFHVDLEAALTMEDVLSVDSIPLLVDLLPEEFEYTDQGLTVRYREGKVVLLKWIVKYSNYEKEKKEKETLPEGNQTAGIEDVYESENPESPADENDQTVRWISVNKQIGSVHISRVGVKCADGIAAAVIDAGLTLGPVSVECKEFLAGYDFNKNMLTGGLRGLILGYESSVFSVSGGIYQVTPSDGKIRTQFDGTVSVKAAKWQMQGMASYILLKDGTTSFFLFVRCAAVLGGIPAFTITGLMGGMGIKRRLVLPDITEVEKFPLLACKNENQMQVLDQLEGRSGGKEWLSVSSEDYWAAAGIEFRSNGLVTGRMLLTLAFGRDIVIGLLGTAELLLPQNAPPKKAYVFLKILLAAVLKPEEGSLTIDAAISEQSFLMHPDCRIRGGAAFYLWFGKNRHAGDFVLTVGGYHPSFLIPKHYPNVPRIGIYWKVSSCIDVKGEAYLAVTPSCIMAGGRLEFLFAEGPLKAWFIAYADILIQWHPFWFDVQLGIEVGVSLRLNLLFCHKTLKLSVGADLNLWGPEIGGKARIHLSILSFSVAFGKKKEGAAPIVDWNGFAELLPDSKERHRITCGEGIEEMESETKESQWLVTSQQFSLSAETAVPGGSISIRPMGIGKVYSDYRVIILGPDHSDRTKEFVIEQELYDFPAALWGSPVKGGLKPDAELVKGRTGGARITSPKPGLRGQIVIEDYRENLMKTCYMDNPLTRSDVAKADYEADWNGDSMSELKEIAFTKQQEKRQNICGSLRDIYSGPAGSFSGISEELQGLYADAPGLSKNTEMYRKGGKS